MSENKTAVKAGLGYTVGNVLVKGTNFLTLPLFSRIMSTNEFGVYNVFISYDSILTVILALAMHTSVKSAHYEFNKTDEYVSSISLIYITNSLLWIAIVIIGGEQLASLLGLSENALFLMISFSFGGAVVQLYNERISLNYEFKKYLFVALLNSIGNVIVSIILILSIFKEQKDIGRIAGSAATLFVIAFVILWKMYGKAAPRYNKKFWRFAILYSLPIVPHGISQVILAQCDRIMISKMVGNSEAGIYSLAGNLKLVLTVVSTSVGASWSTWFFSKMDKGEKEEIQKNSGFLVSVFMILVIGLMTLSPEIIHVLGGSEYDMGKYVAIPMIMDAFILFLYNIVVSSEYYIKKTQYIMMGTMIAAIINLITNYFFIRCYGFIAAAYTTLFSYFCYLVLHAFFSARLVGFKVIRWKYIAMAVVLVGAFGIYNTVFVDNILARYGTSAAFIGMLTVLFAKRYRRQILSLLKSR